MIAMFILCVKNDYVQNYLITASCCAASTLIICIIFSVVIKRTKDISTIKLIITTLVCTLISFGYGYLFEYLVLNKWFKINICAIEYIIAVIYKTAFSVMIGVLFSHKVFSKLIEKN